MHVKTQADKHTHNTPQCSVACMPKLVSSYDTDGPMHSNRSTDSKQNEQPILQFTLTCVFCVCFYTLTINVEYFETIRWSLYLCYSICIVLLDNKKEKKHTKNNKRTQNTLECSPRFSESILSSEWIEVAHFARLKAFICGQVEAQIEWDLLWSQACHRNPETGLFFLHCKAIKSASRCLHVLQKTPRLVLDTRGAAHSSLPPKLVLQSRNTECPKPPLRASRLLYCTLLHWGSGLWFGFCNNNTVSL